MSAAPGTVATLAKSGREEVRIALTEFKGHQLLDIRGYVDFTAAGVPMPTKRGLSIRVAQLPELIEALGVAKAEARKVGWLGGDA